MKWIFLLILIAACTTPTAEPVKETPIPRKYFEVTLPAPTSDETAMFEVAREGQDGYEKEPTRVTVGDKVFVVPLGERQKIPFGFNPTGLTRFSIGVSAHLVAAYKNSYLMLGDDPCNGWSLGTHNNDPNFAEAPLATCVPETEKCPEGMWEHSGPGLAEDPLCPEAIAKAQTGKRCVRPSTIDWTGPSELKWGYDERVVKTPAKIETRFRCFEYVKTNADEVGVVIGLAEHWTLREVDGKIVGANEPFETH